MGQQGAPETKPDTARGPVQPQPIITGQCIEAKQHHQDLPYGWQNGTQQKLGVAGVEVIERRHLTADRHRLPERTGQRLAIGHRLQHAYLTIESAYHLRQRRVDQLGDQDELAVVEHSHLRLGALTGIPLQMVGDHHQRIDVATAQGSGAGIDGVKLLRHLEPGRAIQREGELAREHAVVEIHQPHLEVAGQPCREIQQRIPISSSGTQLIRARLNGSCHSSRNSRPIRVQPAHSCQPAAPQPVAAGEPPPGSSSYRNPDGYRWHARWQNPP